MLTLSRNLRRVVAISVATLILAACGGAATNPPAGIASGPPLGFMSLAVSVAAPVGFAKYRYEIVFNTLGNGLTPEAGSGGKGLAAYSYALEAGGNGSGTVTAWEYLRSAKCSTCIPARVSLLATPSQLLLVSNGASAEFTILLDRSIFTNTNATWLFNAFTTQNKTGAVIDSMGACAACFVSPKLLVSETFQSTVFAELRRLDYRPGR